MEKTYITPKTIIKEIFTNKEFLEKKEYLSLSLKIKGFFEKKGTLVTNLNETFSKASGDYRIFASAYHIGHSTAFIQEHTVGDCGSIKVYLASHSSRAVEGLAKKLMELDEKLRV